ncbi:hypothetical protein HDU97_001096 [Phlyctochytrium planicorne]|nr:hypothetical protein HDU97_001096 [Phlyctochytrium planicorne]
MGKSTTRPASFASASASSSKHKAISAAEIAELRSCLQRSMAREQMLEDALACANDEISWLQDSLAKAKASKEKAKRKSQKLRETLEGVQEGVDEKVVMMKAVLKEAADNYDETMGRKHKIKVTTVVERMWSWRLSFAPGDNIHCIETRQCPSLRYVVERVLTYLGDSSQNRSNVNDHANLVHSFDLSSQSSPCVIAHEFKLTALDTSVTKINTHIRLPIIGKADLLLRDAKTGKFIIADVKTTSNRLPLEIATLKITNIYQLCLYHVMLKELIEDLCMAPFGVLADYFLIIGYHSRRKEYGIWKIDVPDVLDVLKRTSYQWHSIFTRRRKSFRRFDFSLHDDSDYDDDEPGTVARRNKDFPFKFNFLD